MICCCAWASCLLVVQSFSSRLALSTHFEEYFSESDIISFRISSNSTLKKNNEFKIMASTNTTIIKDILNTKWNYLSLDIMI